MRKLSKYLANLGYGSRQQVLQWLHQGRLTLVNGEPITPATDWSHVAIRVDGQPLDPPPGFTIMLHKPPDCTCSRQDQGALVYHLLPPRFAKRSPMLSIAGRLDRQTSGLLILTDDGKLLHRLISPRQHVTKTYEVSLAEDLRGDESRHFASGQLLLRGDSHPLRPVDMVVLGPRRARLVLREGRYHQIRRMFSAVGNHVQMLHRSHVGRLALGHLQQSQWRPLASDELFLLFDTEKS